MIGPFGAVPHLGSLGLERSDTKPNQMEPIVTALRNALRFVKATGYGHHLREQLEDAVRLAEAQEVGGR